MTEEIIIDGVNVAGCEYFDGFCMKRDTSCEEGGNCIYKQLKRLQEKYDTLTNKFFNSETDKTRLEQENKELKAYKDVNEDFKKAWDELNEKYTEVLKLAKENADSNEYCLQELEKENKELKDNNNHLQAIIDDGRAENKRFREENKELRQRLSEIGKNWGEINELRKQIESQKGLITVGSKQQYEMTIAYDKLKTALEEIKTYLNTLSSIDSDFPNTETYLRIQDKINEVLNDTEG